MGLLDTFNNWQQDTDMESPNNQRMMAIAAALLSAGGPSRTPTSLGQALGGAMQFGQQAYQGAQDRLTQADLRKQQKALQGLQMKGLGIDIQGKQTAMDQAEAQKRAFMNFRKSKMTPAATTQQPMQDQGMAEELAQLGAAGAPSMPMGDMPQTQIQAQPQAAQTVAQPAGQSGKANPIQSQISRLNEMADYMEQSEGISGEAYRKQAFDLMGKLPKVKDWQKVNVGGQVLFAPYYDDGSSGQPVPLQVAEKLHFANIGGSTVGTDAFTGKTISEIKNTQSPENIATVNATMRGQNMMDARARDTLALNANSPTYLETTGGIVALPKKLGAGEKPVGVPVLGQDGKALEKRKDIPSYVIQGVTGNAKSLEVINNALKGLDTKAGKDAVGLKGYLPNVALNRVDPEGTATRADIADIGSLTIHDRSGAAVTAAESPRLMPFIPLTTDNAETARKKLTRMKQLLEAETNNLTFQFPQAKNLANYAAGNASGNKQSADPIESLLNKYK